MEHYPLKVMKKAQETESAFSFYLKPAEKDQALFSFRPAQFLTFKANISGKDVLRSYSIASSPLLDEPLRVIAARLPGGAMSNHLIDHVHEGDAILSQPPLGSFFTPPASLRLKDYILLAAGIGITPLLSILKTVLAASSEDRVYLIFSNRSEDHIIARKEIEGLERRFKGRLFISHVLSQKEGRLNPEKLRGLLAPILQSGERRVAALCYLCGPKAYMDMARESLLSFGVKKESVKTEDFKTVPVLGPKPDEGSLLIEAPPFEEGPPERLEALLDGQRISIPMGSERSLLEQLLEAGHAPPFSCTSGSCMTCMARLKEGKVFQPEEGVLDEDSAGELKMLSCQAYPLSKKVSIDYDDI